MSEPAKQPEKAPPCHARWVSDPAEPIHVCKRKAERGGMRCRLHQPEGSELDRYGVPITP